MTIDERLEALTQSVELLASMHQDNEKRIEDGFARVDAQISRVVGSVEKLVLIVESHERRLNEGGL